MTKTTAANNSGYVVESEGAASLSGGTSAPTGPANPHHRSTRPAQQPSPYNASSLLKALLALLGLLLGLTLWLGGWQPATSSARLGWSHGTIDVVAGTDGDTGSHPLSPNDNAPFHLAGQEGSPVDLPQTFFEGSGPGGLSLSPVPGGSQA